MLNKSRSNKGFTLLELLIAISIFSIVIGLGYTIINKTSEASSNQGEISKEQQSANLINKYLTKDLEMARDVEGDNIDIDGNITSGVNASGNTEYSYTIRYTDEEEPEARSKVENIKYSVILENSSNDVKYSITRISGESEIELSSNQSYKPEGSKAPLQILKPVEEARENESNSKNMYNVIIGYSENKYEFSINPRTSNVEDSSGDRIPSVGKGNIVVDIYEDSIDVSLSKEIQEGVYKKQVQLTKFKGKNKGKVYILENPTDEYLIEKYTNKIEPDDGGIEVELFSDDIEIFIKDNGYVEVEIEGDKAYKSSNLEKDAPKSSNRLNIELDDDYQDDVQNIEIITSEKLKATNINKYYEENDKDKVERFPIDTNPSVIEAYKIRHIDIDDDDEGDDDDDDDLDYDMEFGVDWETKNNYQDSHIEEFIIVNFDLDIKYDKEVVGEGVRLKYYQNQGNKEVKLEVLQNGEFNAVGVELVNRPSNNPLYGLDVYFKEGYAITRVNSTENIRPIYIKIIDESITEGYAENVHLNFGHFGEIELYMINGESNDEPANNEVIYEQIYKIECEDLKFTNGNNKGTLEIKWNIGE